MEQEELIQFVQWLPSKVAEFQNKTPDEIVGELNQMAQSEEGMNVISGLINQFKQEQSTGMFKKGGKLNYLVTKFKEGGSAKEKRKENKKTVKEGKKSSKFNRTAYRNMKSALKDQDLGLGRRDIKAAAMRNVVGDSNKNIVKQEGITVNPISFGNVTMKTGPVAKAKISSQTTPDLSQGSFNQAFAAARNGGFSTFNWRGKTYGTQLEQPRPAPGKPNLPRTSSNLSIPGVEQRALAAARGIRPEGMNEELVMTNPFYSDYIVMSNLGNVNRFDSRYVAPRRTVTTGTENNVSFGHLPIEYRTNPKVLSSFLQKGGKTKNKVKVNPNDSTAVSKALNNRTGDNNIHDVFNTTGLVRDSLIKVGYNPTMVNRIANPIISNAERKLDEFAPEQYTPRQYNLIQFLGGMPAFFDGGDLGKIQRDTTSVNRTVVPGEGNYRDRRMEIVSRYPDRTKEVATIDRMISNDQRDTTYYQTTQRYLPNENPIGKSTTEQVRPSKAVKDKMK